MALTDDSLRSWAKTIYTDIHAEHKRLNELYNGILDPGYAIFYNSKFLKTDLLIIGFNPGGKGEPLLDDENEYRYPEDLPGRYEYSASERPENGSESEPIFILARKMRELFSLMNMTKELETSVKINHFFFRSQNVETLNTLNPELRLKLEEMSDAYTKTIIENLNPKAILTEGIATFDNISKILKLNSKVNNHALEVNDKRRLLISRKLSDDCILIGMLHPSGSRASSSKLKIVREELKSLLQRILK